MDIREILSAFSNRMRGKGVKNKEIFISKQTRNRVLMILKKCFDTVHNSSFESFLSEIHQSFQFKLGTLCLSSTSLNQLNELLNFIITCQGEDFLDFLEYVFRTEQVKRFRGDVQNKLVNDINYIFEKDEVPFRMTNYIEEWVEESGEQDSRFSNPPATFRINVIARPQVINKDDDFTYSEIVAPALDLLKDSRFSNANKEFLEALEHYKNKRYKESITSCCNSLESVIKVIGNIKRWEYEPKALVPLIKAIVITGAKFPSWYEDVLKQAGVIRNKIGSSHGRGDENIIATKSEARYQINIVASEIIFLIEKILHLQ